RLKEGVSASDAIEDAFAGKVVIECEIALQLVFARAILQIAGKKAFDRAFGDTAPPSKLTTLYGLRIVKDRDELLPGDFVYFHNPADYSTGAGPWKGE